MVPGGSADNLAEAGRQLPELEVRKDGYNPGLAVEALRLHKDRRSVPLGSSHAVAERFFFPKSLANASIPMVGGQTCMQRAIYSSFRSPIIKTS